MAKMIQVPYKTKRYFTTDDIAHLIYFQFPKLLMYGEKYKNMSADGKLFYMLCLDLIKLSMKEGWKDEYGRYYIKMSLETIKKRMNCQNTKAVNLKKELIKFELMESVRVGQGKADRLYILQLDYTNEDIYKANNDHEDIENDEFSTSKTTEPLQPQENSDLQSSRNPEIGEQELCKSETIKNKYINNKKLKEEEEGTSYSELITFLLSKDIVLENALIFENALLETTITGYTYDDVLKAIELSLRDFRNEACNEPYKWAVGKLKRMLDRKIKEIEKKPRPKDKTRKGKTKPIRTEMLPNWFNEDENIKEQKVNNNPHDLEAKKKALQERLKKYKG